MEPTQESPKRSHGTSGLSWMWCLPRDMGLQNTMVLCQATGYVVALVLATCLLVPMGINQAKFRGHCLLYTTGTFRESDGNLVPHWASSFHCILPMVVGVLSAAAAMVQVVRMGHFLFHNLNRSVSTQSWRKLTEVQHCFHSTFLSAFLDAIVCLLLGVLVFGTAVSFTVGYSVWCHTVMERFPTCDNAALTEIDTDDNISTLNFYLEIGAAQTDGEQLHRELSQVVILWNFLTLVVSVPRVLLQFGIWGSFVTWVFLSVLACWKLAQYHERERIIVSMARERRRIIGNEQQYDPLSYIVYDTAQVKVEYLLKVQFC
ncbi:hypothetical protein LAZ67_19000220 [Cordylochernes scorpioides]|uniref:Uncharacterized protein n=1 Tax=Cordylochernes scorpioides TaxID=51811 RepID=A0ABY6LGZ3_9ARAC|nr:hypothetical protein LAZ67_19000220 [Cordylochernes scorpioides]